MLVAGGEEEIQVSTSTRHSAIQGGREGSERAHNDGAGERLSVTEVFVLRWAAAGAAFEKPKFISINSIRKITSKEA